MYITNVEPCTYELVTFSDAKEEFEYRRYDPGTWEKYDYWDCAWYSVDSYELEKEYQSTLASKK